MRLPMKLGVARRSQPWTLQCALLPFVCFSCVSIFLFSLNRLDDTSSPLFLIYFQPLLPPLLMLWLWVLNLHHFERNNVDFEACFSSRDRKYLAGSADVAQIAFAATALCASLATLFILTVSSGLEHVAEFVPAALFVLLPGLLLLPFNLLHRPTRFLFAETLSRVLLPFQTVSWSDFLLADMMTSLSKGCADASRAVCSQITGPALQQMANPEFDQNWLCGPLAPPVLGAMVLPYVIRFIQCLIVFRTTGSSSQVFNAVKYASAFPALLLTAMEHEAHVAGEYFMLQHTWVFVMLVNSLYSFYWDVEQDWDMPWLAGSVSEPNRPTPQTGPHLLQRCLRWPALRSDSLYPKYWYAWALASNLFLRLTWTHRLLGDLEAHAAVTMAVALLEVYRRHQWAYIRVETELRKIRARDSRGQAGGLEERTTSPLTALL